MDSKLSRLCDGLLEAGWLAAVISVPLFFNIHSERVFEPDKLTLLRSIAVFMALVWFVKFVDQKGWQKANRLGWRHEQSIWRQPFVLPIVGLVLVYLASTIFSVTPRVSWAGSYQRLQGTYTTLSYVIIGGAAATTIRSRAQIGRIVTAIIITSIPVAFYGLIQHVGRDPLPWGGDVVNRVAGHMGNAIFIAAYLIMVVPLTLGRIIDAFTNILADEDLSYADVVRSSIYIFIFAIQLLTIYWSGSRGPLIALATGLFSFTLVLLVSLRDASGERGALRLKDVALAVTLLIPSIIALLFGNALLQTVSSLASFMLYIGVILLSVLVVFLLVALRKGWRWLWLSWLLLTAFVAGWLLLFNIPAQRMIPLRQVPVIGSVLETQLAWKELPVVGSYGRMLDPSQTGGREKSNRVRVLIWEGVIDLISPHEALTFADDSSDKFNLLRPLIGYGPESMYVAYNRFYPPELATVEARNASPDRSHNETFDALVITGLAGFLIWQALYVSAFYYGFRFLGVVGSRRERNLLIGAWLGGGLLGGIVSLTLLDPIYFGVGVPMGTIIGLVGYLFYYALFSKREVSGGEENDDGRLPFHVDRLLMNGLLAAVLAHYVEIHFGIAISSTRMYFFIFVALMFLIGIKLPGEKELERTEVSLKRKRRKGWKKRSDLGSGRWGPILMWSFMLALIVGILGFEFTNYVVAQGETVASGSDLTAGEIFNQSMFVNAQQGFVDSSAIFLMIVLTWALGCLIVLSEMLKQKELSFALQGSSSLLPWRRYLAAAGLGVLALFGMGTVLIVGDQSTASPNSGGSVALLGTVVLVWAAVSLLHDRHSNRLVPAGIAGAGLLLILGIIFTQSWSLLDLMMAWLAAICMAALLVWSVLRSPTDGSIGRFTALIVAASGLMLALPILVAGGWLFGSVMAVIFAVVIYLLWEESWRTLLLSALILGALSWIIGIAFSYLHAVNLREALLYLIFYQGIEPISSLFSLFFRPTEMIENVTQLRVLEATQSMRFLSGFYIFLFVMLLLSGIALASRAMSHIRSYGSSAGYVTFVVAAILGIIVVNQTNLRVVQADMVYKRGKPFDDQALRQNDPLNWDVAIAIYEEALDLTPLEDFYYLFLGRAFLERSATTDNKEEQTALYKLAEEGLLQAQSINPLNTDHTANLARLNTRWYAADPESTSGAIRLEAAEKYYQDALELSPNNSIIHNEYARLTLELKKNCDETLALYEESLAIDPFYATTYFAMTDALVACAAAQSDETAQNELYTSAAQSLADGLSREPGNARAWLQSGQILQKIGENEAALSSYEKVRETDHANTIPTWNIDFAEAAIYRDMGELAMARSIAEQARQTAPPEVADQIEAFIASLGEE